jgi:hypothetical protein
LSQVAGQLLVGMGQDGQRWSGDELRRRLTARTSRTAQSCRSARGAH